MGDREEYGESDWRRMEQQHHPGFPLGVSMGRSDVHCRHGHSLATDELEKTLSLGFQRYADLGDRDSRLPRYHRHLSIRLRRDATLHIFSVLNL